MTIIRFSSFATLLGIGTVACGGAISRDGQPSTDGGAADQEAVALDGSPPLTPADSGVPPQPLFPLAKLDEIAAITFDDSNVYAEVFSPASAAGNNCTWKSRWVRVGKDGKVFSELGDAATCILDTSATAVVIGDALYWLSHEIADAASSEVAVLMTLPTIGGAAVRVKTYDRDLDGLGTDGASLFAVASGTTGAGYADGSVLRLDLDGTAATLAENQPFAQWVGVDRGVVAWSTLGDCDFGGNCQSTSFHTVSTSGGAVALIEKRNLPHVFPTTLYAGAIFYFDETSSIRRLALDGSEATFVDAQWKANGTISLDRLRVTGDEVVAGADVSPDIFLEAAPRPFKSPFADSAVFEIDNGVVYAQRNGALVRMPVP